jgi:hypothetical protein
MYIRTNLTKKQYFAKILTPNKHTQKGTPSMSHEAPRPEQPQPTVDQEVHENAQQETARARAVVRGGYIMFALRELQHDDRPTDITMDYDLIKSGAAEFPGNGQPITTDDAEKAQAGYALLKVQSTLLGNETALRPEDDYDRLNPFLQDARAVLEEAGLYDTEQETPTAALDSVSMSLRELGEGLHFGDKQKMGAVVRELPRTAEFNEALHTEFRAARGVYKAGGMENVEAYYADDTENHLQELDTSQVVPDYITPQGGESYDAEGLFAGVPIHNVAVPVYDALIGEGEYPEAFRKLAEDLRQLSGGAVTPSA